MKGPITKGCVYDLFSEAKLRFSMDMQPYVSAKPGPGLGPWLGLGVDVDGGYGSIRIRRICTHHNAGSLWNFEVD